MVAGRDWSNLLLLYIFVQFSRVVVVGLLYPGLKFFGYGMSWKEATILIWAGLRGAVALSLSLSVAVSAFIWCSCVDWRVHCCIDSWHLLSISIRIIWVSGMSLLKLQYLESLMILNLLTWIVIIFSELDSTMPTLTSPKWRRPGYVICVSDDIYACLEL